MRTLLFLLLLVFGPLSLSAQIVDSLPWFKAEFYTIELENIVGPLGPDQQSSLASQLAELRRSSTAPQPGKNLRQQVRQTTWAILTPEQRNKLKALKGKKGRDPIERILQRMRAQRKQ